MLDPVLLQLDRDLLLLGGIGFLGELIAVELQKYWVEHPTHVHLGEWYQPIALRADIEGVMIAPATAFWNMSRKK